MKFTLKSDSNRVRYVFDSKKSDLDASKIVRFGLDSSQISAPSLNSHITNIPTILSKFIVNSSFGLILESKYLQRIN